MTILKALIAATLLSTLGCQSNPLKVSCSEADWFEMGRRDGAIGRAPQLDAQRKSCGKYFSPMSETLFTSGYNNGIAEYCSEDNGYDIGVSGSVMQKVCPAPMDIPFLEAVEKGRKAREISSVARERDASARKLKETENQVN